MKEKAYSNSHRQRGTNLNFRKPDTKHSQTAYRIKHRLYSTMKSLLASRRQGSIPSLWQSCRQHLHLADEGLVPVTAGLFIVRSLQVNRQGTKMRLRSTSCLTTAFQKPHLSAQEAVDQEVVAQYRTRNLKVPFIPTVKSNTNHHH
jgi:hypothetical protein